MNGGYSCPSGVGIGKIGYGWRGRKKAGEKGNGEILGGDPIGSIGKKGGRLGWEGCGNYGAHACVPGSVSRGIPGHLGARTCRPTVSACRSTIRHGSEG